jgi:NADPH dehydrogenase (quinone)
MTRKTTLIINGAEVRNPAASGRLNTLLFETLRLELSSTHTILTTEVRKGYDVANEQHKFLEADLIVFQTPVFWFSLPSIFKRYIDDVYSYGVFFGRAGEYGRGGLLSGKQYMLSMTWNAKSTDFDSTSGFLGQRTADDVMLAFHLTQRYIGLQQLPSFSEYNVVQSPNSDRTVSRLREHLNQYILIPTAFQSLPF